MTLYKLEALDDNKDVLAEFEQLEVFQFDKIYDIEKTLIFVVDVGTGFGTNETYEQQKEIADAISHRLKKHVIVLNFPNCDKMKFLRVTERIEPKTGRDLYSRKLRMGRRKYANKDRQKTDVESTEKEEEIQEETPTTRSLSRKEMDKVEADVAIDRSKLDWENARQTRLFEKYNKKYMKALEDKLIQEEVFNGKKAKMAGDIRRNAKDYGLDKMTEGAVMLALPNHPDFEAAHKLYLEYYLRYDYYLGVIENIGKRPTLLSNLGRLIEVGYWTRTSMSQEELLEED
jgi:hypothetical protein